MLYPETTSECELCDNNIDLTQEGWQETDTGDVCADCVAEAAAADDTHVNE